MPGLDDGQDQSHKSALKRFERDFKAKKFYSITEVGVWSLASKEPAFELLYIQCDVEKEKGCFGFRKVPKISEVMVGMQCLR